MSKLMKKVLCLMICFSLTFGSSFFAAAEEAGDEEIPVRTLTIRTLSDFLEFVEGCRLDSYSKNLTVYLETDIDLTDIAFKGVPIFCGTFEGKGNSITGLSVTADGSSQGLFRCLTVDGVVKNLTVSGTVTPGGSRSQVGGIVGTNAGVVVGCSFSGTVIGADQVGGIAGYNEVTGMVEGCFADGTVYGNHFVGGIAGENAGVIRQCTNHGQINAAASQNSVDISEITLGTLTGVESAATVTDVGGIVGLSTGVIRSCINHGTVGYLHMGYNMGGIAGTQSGYVEGCTNYGTVFGRKEAGGIVGQMEPASLLEYKEDSLQILGQQLNVLAEIADRTKANADSSSAAMTNQINLIRSHINEARTALETLMLEIAALGGQEEMELDRLFAAVNSLRTSLEGISNTLNSLLWTTQNAGITLKHNLEALEKQLNVIRGTLDGASENLGGTITDVSDLDTAENLTSKVSDCVNHGAVSADINAGGVVGAISLENDLDPESDLEISGEMSLNFAGEFRSVIMNCKNSGAVTAKKQRVGGIVGWMLLGLVKDSQNVGDILSPTADFAGGIAGQSNGYIRRSDVKCTVTGDSGVGGIAGQGLVVSDCRSMVSLTGNEKVGAVLGYTEQRIQSDESVRYVLGNVYRPVGRDQGGIDGVSYAGSAEGLSHDEFLALDGLAEIFTSVTVTFLFEDGTKQMFSVPVGGTLDWSKLPPIPEKEGYIGYWERLTGKAQTGNGSSGEVQTGERLTEEELREINFDMTVKAAYVSLVSVVQSEQTDDRGLPILLAEGVFRDVEQLSLKAAEDIPALAEGETLIEAWEVTFPAGGESVKLRYLIPEENRDDKLKLMVKLTGRVWDEVEYTVDGSYLVFTADAEDSAFCLIKGTEDYRLLWFGGAAAAVVVLGAAAVLVRRKKKQVKS